MYIHLFIQQVFISSVLCIGAWSGDTIVNKVISHQNSSIGKQTIKSVEIKYGMLDSDKGL